MQVGGKIGLNGGAVDFGDPRQMRVIREFEPIGVEAGSHRGSEQSETATLNQASPLPGSRFNEMLNPLSRSNVGPQSRHPGVLVISKRDHIARITQVEVKEFIIGKSMEGRKGRWCHEIEDGCGGDITLA